MRAQPRVITTPFAVAENRVWIAATIGGSGPYQFIVDTGAVVSLIQERLARQLGMRERGVARLAGIGGPENFMVYEGRDVAFSSGAVQRSVVFGAIPPELVLGRDAAGAFSAGLFTQADSEFDRCIKRRGETLALFLDEEPTYGYFPSVYYYQGRVREGLRNARFAESYRAYLDIRGKSTEDSLLPELRRRAGQ